MAQMANPAHPIHSERLRLQVFGRRLLEKRLERSEDVTHVGRIASVASEAIRTPMSRSQSVVYALLVRFHRGVGQCAGANRTTISRSAVGRVVTLADGTEPIDRPGG